MLVEEWKDIKGYEGFYQVSNYGRIKRLEGFVKSAYDSKQWRNEKILKNVLVKKDKYYEVSLSKHGIADNFFVHQLVAIHFISNPLCREFINHINNDGLNNYVLNLEWTTHKENYEHSRRQGRHTIHPLNRKDISIEISQFSKDGLLVKNWLSSMDAERAGFDSGHIIKCCMNKPKYNSHKGFIWKYKQLSL